MLLIRARFCLFLPLPCAADLADGPVRVPQVHQQVVALKVEVHNVLGVEVLHPKRGVHGDQDALATVHGAGDRDGLGSCFKKACVNVGKAQG